MRGKHRVVIQNNRLHYELEIKRNITILQGNSATGKTTLIDMLRQAENFGSSSGIEIISDVPCRVLEGRSWKILLNSMNESIIFVDEENSFINTEEFATAVQKSDNYFVLITRENLYNLPYSVEEIYGLYSSGKYQNTRKVYQQMYRIYSSVKDIPAKPKKIIAEDSNSGFEFFSWERFFTRLLIERTEGTYLKYSKSRLNPVYLHDKNKDKILKNIRGIIL